MWLWCGVEILHQHFVVQHATFRKKKNQQKHKNRQIAINETECSSLFHFYLQNALQRKRIEELGTMEAEKKSFQTVELSSVFRISYSLQRGIRKHATLHVYVLIGKICTCIS